jgi:hypothetical protein
LSRTSPTTAKIFKLVSMIASQFIRECRTKNAE